MERKQMKYYKLLTQDLKSHNNTQWQIGVPITIQKEGVKMCTDQVLHCYNHPLLAVLFNPIHAKIQNPKLFEISVDQIVNTDGLKFASKSQTLIGEIPLPQINTEQRIEFTIKVAKCSFSGRFFAINRFVINLRTLPNPPPIATKRILFIILSF